MLSGRESFDRSCLIELGGTKLRSRQSTEGATISDCHKQAEALPKTFCQFGPATQRKFKRLASKLDATLNLNEVKNSFQLFVLRLLQLCSRHSWKVQSSSLRQSIIHAHAAIQFTAEMEKYVCIPCVNVHHQ